VEHFLQKFNRELDLSVTAVSPETLARLVEAPWPGNVRELENCIKRAMVLTRRSVLLDEDFAGLLNTQPMLAGKGDLEEVIADAVERVFQSIPPKDPGTQGIPGLLERVERHLVERALTSTDGNQVRAARVLGISRTTLRSKLKRYGLI
jgi:DNA-binding NtrC family response regulator